MRQHAEELCDLFCRNSRSKIKQLFRDLWWTHDDFKYQVARRVLDGDHQWIEVTTPRGMTLPTASESADEVPAETQTSQEPTAAGV